MHTSLNRLQTAFGFFTSCAFTIASLIALLSVVPLPTPSASPHASISVRDVQVVKGRPHYYSPKREEYAQIKFDLDADLSSLFTWNTKQVFVYVTVNYPSGADGAVSEAVIWDQIIHATQTPFSLQNLKTQYWDSSQKKSPNPTKARTRKTSQDKTTTDLVQPGLISLKKQKPKYQITDPSGKLSERANATLQVSWNVQPWVGGLLWDKGYLGGRVGAWEAGKVGRSDSFTFPVLKGAKTEVVRGKTGPTTPEAGSATPVADV